MLRPIHIALLEVKRYAADTGGLLFSLALPIVLFALMYGVFGGEVTFNGTAHMVDLDKGAVAQTLLSRLEEVDGLKVKLHTAEEADRALDRSSILTAVVIPSGFSAGLNAGEPVSLVFKKRGSGDDEGQIVASIVQGVAQGIAGEFQVRRQVSLALEGTALDQSQIARTVSAHVQRAQLAPLVTISARVIGGSEDPVDRMVPGVLVMFLMFAVTLGAQTLVEERRIGTLERLMTTRLGIHQLFIGKFLAGAGRATLQALILLALAFAVLRMAGVQEFVQTLVFSLLIAAAVSAIGLVIGAVARTPDQAAWTAVFFTMFMTVFGGTFIDVGDTGLMALLSRFTLNKYAIDGLADIISGVGGLGQQGPEAAVLAGVAIVGLIMARALFRASEGGR